MNAELTLADIILVAIGLCLTFSMTPLWLIPVGSLIISWVWCPRWSSKTGWRFWR